MPRSRSFSPASRETPQEYSLLAHCIYLFIVYSCPVGAVLVGTLLAHIYAMPKQTSKKRKHEPYSNPKRPGCWKYMIKKHILSAHEFGERLAEHVNAKRKADLSTKPRPGKASRGLGQRQEKCCSHNQGEVSE
jgi:hypothetical protein